MTAMINEQFARLTRSVIPRTIEPSNEHLIINQTRYLTFNYAGRFHMVPEGFVFPTCAAQSMWSQWHLGISAQNIGPLRKLHNVYRNDIALNKRYLIDKAKVVMDAVENIARRINILTRQEIVDSSNCWQVWNAAFPEYLKHLYTNDALTKLSFRSDDIYYTTLHKVHTQKVGETETGKTITKFDSSFNIFMS